MYVNSKGNNSRNANWTKGNNKKERPLYTHCNMLGHTIVKCYKLHGYPPGYKPKGTSNANQVSYDQGALVEHSSLGSVQCPITKAQLCYVIFLGTFYFIQDLAHWSTFGMGREYNGLYLLEKSKSISTSTFVVFSVNSIQPHVWHLRLGHLSNAKLVLMMFNKVPLHDFVNNFLCDICPLAKQKRLPFQCTYFLALF